MNLRRTATAASTALVLAAAAGLAGCDKTAKSTSPTDGTTKPAPTVSSPPPATPSTTVGAVVDDASTTAKIKSAMLADPDVKGLQVNVDTKDGVVTLSGTVDTKSQADKAAVIAEGIAGVKSVNNNLAAKS